MKKIITALLFVYGNIMYASAVILNTKGTLFGVPISVNGIPIGEKQATVGQVNGGPILGIIGLAQSVVSRLAVFAIGVALLAFFWYLIKFIWKGDESAEARTTGVRGMGYSILALFVMVSIWGIIALMASILGTGIGGSIPALEMPKAK